MTFSTKFMAATACAVAAVSAHPVAAQTGPGLSVDEVKGAMQYLGHTEKKSDSFDPENPTILGAYESGGESYNYTVKLGDCAVSTQRCGTVMIFATFATDAALSQEALTALNVFNDSTVLGRAFAYDGAVGVDFNFVADMDNPSAYFRRRLAQFPGLVDEFISSLFGG